MVSSRVMPKIDWNTEFGRYVYEDLMKLQQIIIFRHSIVWMQQERYYIVEIHIVYVIKRRWIYLSRISMIFGRHMRRIKSSISDFSNNILMMDTNKVRYLIQVY